jgi:hypothetical protein
MKLLMCATFPMSPMQSLRCTSEECIHQSSQSSINPAKRRDSKDLSSEMEAPLSPQHATTSWCSLLRHGLCAAFLYHNFTSKRNLIKRICPLFILKNLSWISPMSCLGCPQDNRVLYEEAYKRKDLQQWLPVQRKFLPFQKSS